MPDKSVQNRSVDRTLDILEAFINVENGLTLNEIALKIDLSSSTVYRLVMTLTTRNYLYRDNESKRFYLGSQLNLLVNLNQIDAKEHLKNVAHPYMQAVFQETNENIGLYIQADDCKLCIDRMESTKALRHVIDIGDCVTMSKGAIGKVLLAFMTPEEWKPFDKEGWPKKEELQKVKNSGYALSIGEREEGLIGIAAPIFNAKGKVIAAVSMSGPSVRFMDELITEKIEIVTKLAKDISAAMGLENSETK